MGIINFFRNKESAKKLPLINDIGEFSFFEFNGTRNYKGIVNSIINPNIELLFPLNGDEISIYQKDYFRNIEQNWKFIQQQIKSKKTKIDIEDFRVISIMIPDIGDEIYDVESEIVIQNKLVILSVIMANFKVIELIEC
jgi:hypothetical protein